VCRLLHDFQIELERLGNHDGGSRHPADTHTTILRWFQHYLPEFEKRWSRYARPVGGSWRTDETYIKVGGRWVYLYRAVDKAGLTVDFFLSRNRDVNAAKTFLRSAMKNTRTPTKITHTTGRR
jgi:transposase-like protein